MASPYTASEARPSSPTSTNLKSIFSKASGVKSPNGGGNNANGNVATAASLAPGSNDHLGVATGSHGGRFNIVRDFVASHGDRTVHFSGEAFEMLHSLPVKRFIVVTENALYRIAQTTVETGIFFDCRVSLDELEQIISQDVQEDAVKGITGGAEVQLFTRGGATPNQQRRALSGGGAFSPLGADGGASPMRGGGKAEVQLLSTLNFGRDMPRRKAFLLSVCVVRPTLSILQKRAVVVPAADLSSHVENAVSKLPSRQAPPSAAGSNGDGPRFAKLTASARVRRDSVTSSTRGGAPVAGGGGGDTPTSTGAMSMSIQARRNTGIGGSTAPVTPGRSPLPAAPTPAYSPAQFRSESPTASSNTRGRSPFTSPSHVDAAAVDLSDDQFTRARELLRESLAAATTDGSEGPTAAYDYDIAAMRPKEEAVERTLERERIKALLASREAQLVQNIEFKVKYPQKVPTRVPPGVEYDKAHEERRALPEDFSDVDLLGPSLYPQWRQWKQSGGLLGEDGMPSEMWSLYDSEDLIESLKSREDVLYGHIGKKPLRRLMEMRELVERERQMFRNKMHMIKVLAQINGVDDEDQEGGSRDRDDDMYGDSASSPYSGTTSPRAKSAAGRSRKSGTIDHSNKGRVASNKYTRVQPFALSKPPSSEQRLKLMDTTHLLGDMKRNFEAHLKTIHQLKKEQLERELARARGDDKAGSSP